MDEMSTKTDREQKAVDGRQVSDGRAGLSQRGRPPSATSRLRARAQWFFLPVMAVCLLLYVSLHSPLRGTIGSLFGFKAVDCYPCGGAPSATRFLDSLVALAFIALALLAAGFVANMLGVESYEWPLAFGLVALAFIVVPSASIGAIGTGLGTGPLRPPLGPLLAATPAAAAILVGMRRGWRPRRPRRPRFGRARGLVLLLGTLSGGMIAGSAVISMMHPPTQGDAIGYHAPLAVFLWSDGNLSAFLDRAPDTWALAHPGTAELWYGLLRVTGGERVANLGQLPFALLAAVAVFVFTLRLGLGRGAGLLAAFAFLLGPIVVMGVGVQPNDVAGGALLMATIALTCAPIATWDRRRLLLIGLGLGLIATTKIALLPSVGAVALFVAGAIAWKVGRNNRGSGAARILLVALAFVVVVVPWWARDLARYGNPVYPANLPFIGRGVTLPASVRIDTEFVPRPIAWPLYPLLEPQDDRSGFGTLFIVGVIPGFVLAVLRARRQPLAVLATVALITFPAWWSYTLHEPRFLLALVGLGFAFVPWSLLALPRRQRPLGVGALVLAALFSTVLTLDQALVPFAREPTARAAFYDRVWGVDPFVSSLPSREGLLWYAGFGPPNEYAAYYPLLGRSLDRRVLPVDSSDTQSTGRIVDRMRKDRVRYAYVSVAPPWQAKVRGIFAPAKFQLVHESAIEVGPHISARRFLYRPVDLKSGQNGIRRYLFRLRKL